MLPSPCSQQSGLEPNSVKTAGMFLIELNLNYDLFGNSCISLGFAFELLQVCLVVFLPAWSCSYKFAK